MTQNTSLQLPSPVLMDMSLPRALGRRRSERTFAAQPVDPAILATVLWACAGQNDACGKRTVPTARDLRSVDAYVFDERGVFLYHPDTNTLEKLAGEDARAATTTGQPFVAVAPVSVVFIGDNVKAQPLSEPMRERCLSLDAGCMMQSALLACAAMGLSAVARASCPQQAPCRAAGLNENRYVVLGAVTLGFPA